VAFRALMIRPTASSVSERPFRPSVNHKQQHRSDKSNRLPTIAVRVRVGLGCMKWIIEYKNRRLERQTMLAAVRRRLARVPDPAHGFLL
jgi:hypothetical protein